MKSFFSLTVAIVGLSLTFNQSLEAQEEKTFNKLFFTELGGPGVLMSAGFDLRFKSDERLGLGYRLGVGFSYSNFDEWNEKWGYNNHITRTYYSFPVGLNYLFGKPGTSKTFEVGAGFSVLTRKVLLYYYEYDDNPGRVIGYFTFMYRLMPENGGFSFRVGLTPIIGTTGDMKTSGAIGFGYVF